jgi:hypothetical protein
MDDTRDFQTALGKAVADAGLELPPSATVWVEKQFDPSQHAKPYKYYLYKESDDDHTRRYYTRPKAISGILKGLEGVRRDRHHQIIKTSGEEGEEDEEEEEDSGERKSETLSQKRRRVHEEADEVTEEDSEVGS